MALLVDLEAFVVPECHGVPYPVAMAAIRDSVKEFLSSSRLWVADLQAFNTVAGVGSYALSNSDDSEITRILRVKVGSRICDPTTEAQLDEDYGDQWDGKIGAPHKYFTRDDGAHITFFHIPAAVEVVNVRAALTISDSSTTYPDVLNQKYRRALAAGAKATLQSMSGAAWENADSSLFNRGIFEDAIGTAKAAVFHGQIGARRRVQARFI